MQPSDGQASQGSALSPGPPPALGRSPAPESLTAREGSLVAGQLASAGPSPREARSPAAADASRPSTRSASSCSSARPASVGWWRRAGGEVKGLSAASGCSLCRASYTGESFHRQVPIDCQEAAGSPRATAAGSPSGRAAWRAGGGPRRFSSGWKVRSCRQAGSAPSLLQLWEPQKRPAECRAASGLVGQPLESRGRKPARAPALRTPPTNPAGMRC